MDSLRELLPAELALLVEAARPEPRPEVLRERARAVRDWDSFVALATRHGLAPLALSRLSAHCAHCVPAGAVEALRARRRHNAARALLLVNELRALLDELAARGVAVIPLRGPLLAARLYGDPALRACADLDLLVRREHRKALADLLVSRGFAHAARPDGERPEYVDDDGEWCFARGDGLCVEPHWELMPATYPWGFRSGQLWQCARPVQFDGRQVLQPSPEHEFVLLCAHAAKHGWEFLSRLADLAWFLTTQPMDARSLAETAVRARCRRAVAVSCFLAAGVFDLVLPGPLMPQGRELRAACAIAQRVIREWRQPTADGPSLSDWWLRLRVLEDARTRSQFLLRALFIPTAGDFALIQLPRTLFPLYYPLHAARMLVKYGLKPLAGRLIPR